MRATLARLTLWSQGTFFGFLLVCIALRPRYLFSANEGGISNFGVHAETVVPYTLAFGATAVLVVLAARHVPRSTVVARRFATGMWTFGVLLACVLASTFPYQHATDLRDLHFAVATAAVAFEGVGASWLVAAVTRRPVDRTAWAVELCGLALVACTVAGIVHALFVSQLVTSGAFGFLLVRAATTLDEPGYATPAR